MPWSLKSSVLRWGRGSETELLEKPVLVDLPKIGGIRRYSRNSHPLQGVCVDGDNCVQEQKWAVPTLTDMAPQRVFKAKLRRPATDVTVLEKIRWNGGIFLDRISELVRLQQAGRSRLLSVTGRNFFPVLTADERIVLVEIGLDRGVWVSHIDVLVNFPPCRAESWAFYPKPVESRQSE